MIDYHKILEDEVVLFQYQQIDEKNKFPFNHGLKHVKNVVRLMEKIIKALNIKAPEAKNLLIAAALHDIGQVEDRENHGVKGKEFAQTYLLDKVDSESLSVILNAIEFHSAKSELKKLPLSTNLLCFVDKMDFSRDRLEDNYKDIFGYVVYENVLDVDFSLLEEKLCVKITTDQTIRASDLLNEKNFFFKVINATASLAEKLERQYLIYVDNERLTLGEEVQLMNQNIE